MTNLPSETNQPKPEGNPSQKPGSTSTRIWSPLATLLVGLVGGIGAGMIGMREMKPLMDNAPAAGTREAPAKSGDGVEVSSPLDEDGVPVAEPAPAGPAASGSPMRVEGVADARPEPSSKAVPKPTPIRALLLRQPDYPALAKRVGIQGPVEVTVAVDSRGLPTTLTTSGNNKVLEKAALDAAAECRFLPATAAGKAVPGTFLIRYEFKLHPDREA